ncbi:unnamed protein product, partial [Amoebophrya sp. A25]
GVAAHGIKHRVLPTVILSACVGGDVLCGAARGAEAAEESRIPQESEDAEWVDETNDDVTSTFAKSDLVALLSTTSSRSQALASTSAAAPPPSTLSAFPSYTCAPGQTRISLGHAESWYGYRPEPRFFSRLWRWWDPAFDRTDPPGYVYIDTTLPIQKSGMVRKWRFFSGVDTSNRDSAWAATS